MGCWNSPDRREHHARLYSCRASFRIFRVVPGSWIYLYLFLSLISNWLLCWKGTFVYILISSLLGGNAWTWLEWMCACGRPTRKIVVSLFVRVLPEHQEVNSVRLCHLTSNFSYISPCIEEVVLLVSNFDYFIIDFFNLFICFSYRFLGWAWRSLMLRKSFSDLPFFLNGQKLLGCLYINRIPSLGLQLYCFNLDSLCWLNHLDIEHGSPSLTLCRIHHYWRHCLICFFYSLTD